MKNKYDTSNPLQIAVFPGDGIGREVMSAALPVFEKLGVPVALRFGEIGWECWKKGGDPVPEASWKLIAETDTALLGAITSKPPREAEAELDPGLRDKNLKYVSPVVQLRRRLGLFANVRPLENFPGTGKPFRCAVIRENTEGLYAGLDFARVPESFRGEMIARGWDGSVLDDAACAMRLATRAGLSRLFAFAFAFARRNGFDRLCLADKPNVLRESGEFARGILEAAARDYPEISWDIQNADAVALALVRDPSRFGVIVAENMFGDVLSDLGAGVAGGLGLAPSANLGAGKSYYEPVHGSAPKHAGRGTANPCAMFLTVALLLEDHGFVPEAARIREAVRCVIRAGRTLTRDLGGGASTDEMAAALLEACASPPRLRRVAVLATGSEITAGETLNTTSREIAKKIVEAGGEVVTHVNLPDDLQRVRRGIESLLDAHEAVVVTGGLGPTSDDVTRFSLAQAVGEELVFDEASWRRLVARLEGFRIAVHESNRRQALFPRGAEVFPNPHGTASGCLARSGGKPVFLLPGPPRECLPMFEAHVLPKLKAEGFFLPRRRHFWRLIGAVEGDIAAAVDAIAVANGIETGFCWRYPYLDVKISHAPDSDPAAAVAAVDALLKPWLVAREEKNATELLRRRLEDFSGKLFIDDKATRGRLAAELVTPRTAGRVLAVTDSGNAAPAGTDCVAGIAGLDELWAGRPFGGRTSVSVSLRSGARAETRETSLPYRGPEAVDYAREYAAHVILDFFQGGAS